MNVIDRIESGVTDVEDAAAVMRLAAALVNMMQYVRPSEMPWIDYLKALRVLSGVLCDDES